MEETSLEIDIGELVSVVEILDKPLHAVELFFRINEVRGKVRTGFDPEFPQEKQIIKEVAFKSIEEVQSIPDPEKHGLLRHVNKMEDLWLKNGYFIFPERPEN